MSYAEKTLKNPENKQKQLNRVLLEDNVLKTSNFHRNGEKLAVLIAL